MKRRLWESTLSKVFCPSWLCPVCKKGTLRLRQKSLTFEETVESKRRYRQDAWGPDEIEFIFNAWADCTHASCAQPFAISGTGGVEQEYVGGDGSWEWVECFYPKAVIPTLDIIELPNGCPQTVLVPLRQAFSVFWSQPEACAARVRVALEALLTHVGVPTVDKTSTEKQTDIPLHRRIELYAKENPEIGQQLMALKWIGNSSSHGGQVARREILDAFELLEHSLIEVLEKRSAKMAALAKKLTEKYGPNGTQRQ